MNNEMYDSIMKLLDFLLAACIVLIIIIAVSSCKSKRTSAYEYFGANSSELAELCSQRFPVTSRYKRGDTIKEVSTLEKVIPPIHTVECPDGFKIDCPPSKEIRTVEIVKVTDTVFEVDGAKVYYLNDELKKANQRILEANDNIDELKIKLKKSRSRLIYSLIPYAIFIAIIVFRRFL